MTELVTAPELAVERPFARRLVDDAMARDADDPKRRAEALGRRRLVSSTSWANRGGMAHGSAPLAVVTDLTLTGRFRRPAGHPRAGSLT